MWSQAGITVEHVSCGRASSLSPIILARAGESDVVAIAGGDGTMNAAAQGLMASQKRLGILPTGTANDLARTFAIPTDLDRAAQIIVSGHERRIDLGNANGHLFFNVASVGLAAHLAKGLTRDTKRRFGRLSYALAAVRTALLARSFTAEIKSDRGVAKVTTLQIAIGNGRFYGGGSLVDRTAEIDDGCLDLCSLELKRVWVLALMVRSFRSGDFKLWREVRTARCNTFEIDTPKPRPVNLDGELLTATPLRVCVHRDALSVLVPPTAPS